MTRSITGAGRPAVGTDGELDALLRQFDDQRAVQIGFPGAHDFDYSELAPFFAYLLNNVGDPEVGSSFRSHTKHLEREVVTFLADLFRAPVDDRWGYVTNGGSESNLYALHLGRKLFPDGLVYCSEAAHYSVFKAIDLLAMKFVSVRSISSGEMDYEDLGRALSPHRDRAAIVVANIGTTVTEAVDDVGRIKTVLLERSMRRHFIHSDAALSGIPLALLNKRPRFDLADGADSIAISGHKFIGTPFPCGVVVTRRSLREMVSQPVVYTGSPDTTISGSRSGHAPLLLWQAIRHHGTSGWRIRADRSRELAQYAVSRLRELGWEAWRNPHAFTVLLKTPSPQLAQRWMLADGGDGWSHIVCVPGVTHGHIDRFLADLALTEGLPNLPYSFNAPSSPRLLMREEQ
jgi:histidine decarboxylase